MLPPLPVELPLCVAAALLPEDIDDERDGVSADDEPGTAVLLLVNDGLAEALCEGVPDAVALADADDESEPESVGESDPVGGAGLSLVVGADHVGVAVGDAKPASDATPLADCVVEGEAVAAAVVDAVARPLWLRECVGVAL